MNEGRRRKGLRPSRRRLRAGPAAAPRSRPLRGHARRRSRSARPPAGSAALIAALTVRVSSPYVPERSVPGRRACPSRPRARRPRSRARAVHREGTADGDRGRSPRPRGAPARLDRRPREPMGRVEELVLGLQGAAGWPARSHPPGYVAAPGAHPGRRRYRRRRPARRRPRAGRSSPGWWRRRRARSARPRRQPREQRLEGVHHSLGTPAAASWVVGTTAWARSARPRHQARRPW